jgi:hypothetical protein
MRRLRSNIAALAALVLALLGLQVAAVGVCTASAAGTAPTLNKQQIQEALAKAKAQTQSSGGSEAGSGASFSKLTEGATGEEESTPSTAVKKSEESSTALSSGVIVPLLVGVGVVLVGIALLILRDARGVTPAGDLLAAATGNAEARAARLRRRRAKAKAARQQRKRNRR